jgi:2-keto-3-deoxy-L-rhamnonate aldolase RhmA
MTNDPLAFRHRLIAGEKLSGTFIKTPSGHATEIFGDVGYDFVVIDEEHAPFDRLAAATGAASADFPTPRAPGGMAPFRCTSMSNLRTP